MTREQKQIIEQLKNEFQLLNQKKEGKAGIISIAELVSRQDNLINRDKEIKMIQKAHDDARRLQIISDMEKLRPEIEALGLVIQSMHKGISICLPKATGSYDFVEIQYEYSLSRKYFNEFYDYDHYKEVFSHPILSKDCDAKYYGNPKFETIEDFVKHDKFREKLAELYRRNKIS